VGPSLEEFAASRGLPLEVCQRRGLFYCEPSNRLALKWPRLASRVIIPHRSYTMRAVTVAGRATSPDTQPKYLYLPGTHKDRWLYGLEMTDASKPVHLVEGQLDVLAFDAIGKQAFAVCGSSISQWQCAQVAGMGRWACIFPDGDMLALKWAETLAQFDVRCVYPQEPYPTWLMQQCSKPGDADPAMFHAADAHSFAAVVDGCEAHIKELSGNAW
jgi:hypothetical protein